jgi:hypothetical protein
MAIYKKRGFKFEKQIVIPNKKKDRYLFGFKFSIGINADTPQRFQTTANWFSLLLAINLPAANKAPGIHFEWNVKPYEESI